MNYTSNNQISIKLYKLILKKSLTEYKNFILIKIFKNKTNKKSFGSENKQVKSLPNLLSIKVKKNNKKI